MLAEVNFDKFRGVGDEPQCREDPRGNRELTLENPDGCLSEIPKVTGLEGRQQRLQLWNLFVPVSPKLLVAPRKVPHDRKRLPSIRLSFYLDLSSIRTARLPRGGDASPAT